MKDDPNVLKDLVTGIRNLLAERLVSPLLPAFTVSWLLVNYRIVITIFSDEDLLSRFKVIDSVLFPTVEDILVKGLLIPLLLSIFYIFLYPFPAKWVYGYALKQQRSLRDKRREVEKATVLTLEESQALMTYYYDRENQLQDQLSNRIRDIEQLRAKIADLEQSKPSDLTSKVEGVLQSTFKETLTPDEVKVLSAMGHHEDRGKTYIEEDDILDAIGRKNINISGLRIILESLVRKSLIQRATSGQYYFQHEGRIALKNHDKQISSEN